MNPSNVTSKVYLKCIPKSIVFLTYLRMHLITYKCCF